MVSHSILPHVYVLKTVVVFMQLIDTFSYIVMF